MDTTVAVAVALAAALVIAVIAVTATLGRRRDGMRVHDELGSLGDRLDSLAGRIDVVIDRSRRPTEGALGSLGEAISSTVELPEVMRRTLAAAGSVGPVHGSEIRIEREGGEVFRETFGLVRPGGRTSAFHGTPDGRPFASALLRFGYDDGATDSVRSGLAVPITHGPREHGLLAVYSTREDAFGTEAVTTLEAVARRAGPAVTNAISYLEQTERAATDELTQLLNRRGYNETLYREMRRARRTGRPLSLALIDLDHFGEVNKTYDWATGDAVLEEFAATLRQTVRATDIPCRRGGEEFGVILPETSREDALRLCHRLAFTVGAQQFTRVGSLTFSAGVAEMHTEDDPDEPDPDAVAPGRLRARIPNPLDARAANAANRAKQTRNAIVTDLDT
jgi:diguanylate cyclase (GGDEF)-like protein